MRFDNKYTYDAYLEPRRFYNDVQKEIEQNKDRAKRRRLKWLARKSGVYDWPEHKCKVCMNGSMSYCSGCDMYNCFRCSEYGQCMCS